MPKSSQMEGRPVMRERLEPLMERMRGLWVGSAEMMSRIWAAAVVKV